MRRTLSLSRVVVVVAAAFVVAAHARNVRPRARVGARRVVARRGVDAEAAPPRAGARMRKGRQGWLAMRAARVRGDARRAGDDWGGDGGVVDVAVAFDDEEDGGGEDEGGDARRRGGVGRGRGRGRGRGGERVRRTGNIRRRVWVSRF